jgi:hypothetical protein
MAVNPNGYQFTRGTGRLICGVFAFVLFVIATFVFLIATTMSIDDKFAIVSAGLAFLALAVAV